MGMNLCDRKKNYLHTMTYMTPPLRVRAQLQLSDNEIEGVVEYMQQSGASENDSPLGVAEQHILCLGGSTLMENLQDTCTRLFKGDPKDPVTLVIAMRGPPGAGKSYAVSLIENYLKFRLARAGWSSLPITLSADKVFTIDGEYHFIPSMVKDAHGLMHRYLRACERLKVPVVLLDNTNLALTDYHKYMENLEAPVGAMVVNLEFSGLSPETEHTLASLVTILDAKKQDITKITEMWEKEERLTHTQCEELKKLLAGAPPWQVKQPAMLWLIAVFSGSDDYASVIMEMMLCILNAKDINSLMLVISNWQENVYFKPNWREELNTLLASDELSKTKQPAVAWVTEQSPIIPQDMYTAWKENAHGVPLGAFVRMLVSSLPTSTCSCEWADYTQANDMPWVRVCRDLGYGDDPSPDPYETDDEDWVSDGGTRY